MPHGSPRRLPDPAKGVSVARLPATARDEPAPHPRLQEPTRSAEAVDGGADACSTSCRAEDAAHFADLRRYLDALGTPYEVAPKLVRGFDYYTRTLFEIKGASDKLGAGDTLVGGGRYDGLVHELGGGPSVPAIGFSAGVERLVIASMTSPDGARVVDAFVAPIGEAGLSSTALVLARDLRAAGIVTDLDAAQGEPQGAAPSGELGRGALRPHRRRRRSGPRRRPGEGSRGHDARRPSRAATWSKRFAARSTPAPRPVGPEAPRDGTRPPKPGGSYARLAWVLLALTLAVPRSRAQMGGMGGGGKQQSAPTQSAPVHQNQVGPRAGGSTDDEEDSSAQPFQRTEPVIAPPTDPLAVPKGSSERIGSGLRWESRPPPSAS